MSSCLVNFVQGLTPEAGVYPQVSLVRDLVEQLKHNFSNNNIFIPLLQTFNVLLEGCALDSLNGNVEGEKQWVHRLLLRQRGYLSINHCQITQHVVGFHEEYTSHQEYFTDSGIHESVCKGVAI